MKLPQLFSYILLLCLFSAFGKTQACEYAGSNISFILKETEKAFENTDLQITRFHIYKALDAISKSDQQLTDCSCTQATESLDEVALLLKNATKTTTLASTRILLKKTLVQITAALSAIRDHDLHKNISGSEEFQNGTSKIGEDDKLAEPPNGKLLKEKIDIALTKYKLSLQNVINTVNCKEARRFALNIYENCEQQLLRADLSEGKKYYNLKTKEITGDALLLIGDCSNP
ncbi:hypothetical protein LCGC14_0858210 [marine sediment metagenome]|uniref:Pectinesterase inhibitor domain-containing protein n=2 Tax=root TaxID=1 RepID=A0A831VRV6_9FLAO|nr:hypothetical protein [Pricia sp.]HEA21332.1 hypothetical protein [Pricia antarctica]